MHSNIFTFFCFGKVNKLAIVFISYDINHFLFLKWSLIYHIIENLCLYLRLLSLILISSRTLDKISSSFSCPSFAILFYCGNVHSLFLLFFILKIIVCWYIAFDLAFSFLYAIVSFFVNFNSKCPLF